MSHQANFLGYYQRAVELARAAHEGFRDQGTPTAMAVAWAMEARAQASLRRERECIHAICQAERWLARRNPAASQRGCGTSMMPSCTPRSPTAIATSAIR